MKKGQKGKVWLVQRTFGSVSALVPGPGVFPGPRVLVRGAPSVAGMWGWVPPLAGPPLACRMRELIFPQMKLGGGPG